MNYIIFDLEFNQEYKCTEKNENTLNCPFEIIQIGAIKLDENLNKVSSLNMIIKPSLYLTINPVIEKLTNINNKDLNSGVNFKIAYESFINMLDSNSVLVVWGVSDIKELLRNIKFHELDYSLIPKKYIDIQRYASKHFKYTKGKNIGLKNAINLLDISFKDEFHNAYNDAYYTSEVFKKLYNDKFKFQIYNNNTRRNSNSNKEKSSVDFHALIKQFEKMFKRPMTTEEISIIKLSYIMGKTNQFQKTKH
ncbi:3'-5' exonuclease [Clostridium ihumii]|uniref:3'-5' exonuclease n=1 Tax=Clostridium ihumii TaxID=1470356 RepID=UPI00058C6A65|nr:3'-5' exonuclease [Clostridium ihumii]